MKKQNNLKKLLSLTKYNFLSTIRNPSALFFGFLFPLIFIAVFGLISSGGGSYDVGVLSSSKTSGDYYDQIKSIDALKLITNKSDAELTEKLKKGQIAATISISQKDTKSPIEVELTTSTAAPQGGAIVKTILENVRNAFNDRANPNAIKVVNLTTKNAEGRKYNQIDFILPGQLSFALLTTGVFTITFSLLTLRKTLVLKRMYATPTSRGIILLAKVLSTMMVVLLQASVIIGVGYFAFGFTLINGFFTFIQMIILSLFGLLVFLGFGLSVSSLADSEDAVSPIANIVTMPQLILSGAFFPIDSFPEFLQGIAKILPMTFLNDAMRAIAFEGATIFDVWPKLLGMAIWALIAYAIAIKIFKWE